MISVALIGAAGAGKSELAQSVVDKYFHGETATPLCIVDRYTSTLHAADVATGMWADMYVNEWIWFLRETREATMRQHDFPFMITCGSGLDTLAYGHLYLDMVLPPLNATPTLQKHYERSLVGLHQLTEFMLTKFDKDLTYILPLPPGDKTDGQYHYNSQIDKKIRDINLQVNLGIPILTGSLREMTDRIVADIKEAREKEVEIERVGILE